MLGWGPRLRCHLVRMKTGAHRWLTRSHLLPGTH
jgi:hypothetical protein